jgi:hypothetical protein
MPHPLLPRAGYILLTLAALPHCASAAPPAFEIGAHIQYHHLEEKNQAGQRLLTESGFIPMIEARLLQPLPLGRVDLALSLSDGTLDYDGRTQSGAGFQSQTDERILRAGLHYAVPVTPAIEVLLGWEFEKRTRTIHGHSGVLGLEEDYRQQMASFGVLWLPYASPHAFTVRGEVLTGIKSEQKISSPGLFDPVTVPGNGMWGTRLSARVPVGILAGGTRIFATPRVEYLHADRSDTRPFRSQGRIAGAITQPETTRWQIGAGIEVAW